MASWVLDTSDKVHFLKNYTTYHAGYVVKFWDSLHTWCTYSNVLSNLDCNLVVMPYSARYCNRYSEFSSTIVWMLWERHELTVIRIPHELKVVCLDQINGHSVFHHCKK